MSSTNVPVDPLLTTDATGMAGLPPGDVDQTDRVDRGRLYGFRALRRPGFRIYVVGMFLRGLAMWMPLVAIPWLAVQLGASPGEVGLVSAFFFLPTLFIGPMGGVLADRVERRRVLVASQLLAAASAASLALLIIVGLDSLAVLAVMSFAFGVLVAIEVPVRQAFMTELVPQGDIASAASLHATAWNTARLVGPVLAGLMIAGIGPASPFVFGAIVSLGVAASVVWMDRYREKGRQRADRSHSILEDLREGASFVLHDPVVRWSVILLWGAVTFGMAMFITLAPLFATRELGLGAEGFGIYLGASGAGALTAALLVTAFAHGDRRPWLIAGALAMAALLAALAIVQLLFLVLVLSFLIGAAQITLLQNALVSVQSATPDMLRGRVMGIWVMTFQAASLFGAILAGWLAEAVGVRAALLFGAGVLALIGLIAAFALRRIDWQLRPAGPASTRTLGQADSP